jgi:hypothetical protein
MIVIWTRRANVPELDVIGDGPHRAPDLLVASTAEGSVYSSGCRSPRTRDPLLILPTLPMIVSFLCTRLNGIPR